MRHMHTGAVDFENIYYKNTPDGRYKMYLFSDANTKLMWHRTFIATLFCFLS